MSLRSAFYDTPTSRDMQLAHIAHAAGAGGLTLAAFRSPCRALLTGIDWIPLAAVTGTNTDFARSGLSTKVLMVIQTTN